MATQNVGLAQLRVSMAVAPSTTDTGDQLPPEYSTAPPELFVATQKPRAGQETVSTTLPMGRTLQPPWSSTAALPELSTATQNVTVAHDTAVNEWPTSMAETAVQPVPL